MRRRRRNRKWIFPVVLLVLALICALLLRFVFVVRSVEVEGNTGVVSDEAVTRAARIGFGSPILKVDAREIGERINATGNVKFEGMTIRYPDTVVIQVENRNREAMVLHLGQIRILDGEACVMESLKDVPNMDLLYVSGLRTMKCEQGRQILAGDGQVEAYCAVIEALNRNAADMYVSELKLDDPQDMSIITRTGITVRLGDVQKINNKIAWMKSAVADLEQRGERGGILDVSSGTKADYRIPVQSNE